MSRISKTTAIVLVVAAATAFMLLAPARFTATPGPMTAVCIGDGVYTSEECSNPSETEHTWGWLLGNRIHGEIDSSGSPAKIAAVDVVLDVIIAAVIGVIVYLLLRGKLQAFWRARVGKRMSDLVAALGVTVVVFALLPAPVTTYSNDEYVGSTLCISEDYCGVESHTAWTSAWLIGHHQFTDTKSYEPNALRYHHVNLTVVAINAAVSILCGGLTYIWLMRRQRARQS